MIRNTASSPEVNRQASAEGIGPDAARVRRRSIDRARSGERWTRLRSTLATTRRASRASAMCCASASEIEPARGFAIAREMLVKAIQ
jgi:hypothetical protein